MANDMHLYIMNILPLSHYCDCYSSQLKIEMPNTTNNIVFINRASSGQ